MDSPSHDPDELDEADAPTRAFEPATRTFVRTPVPADAATTRLGDAPDAMDFDASIGLGPRPRDEPGANRLLARLEAELLGREPEPIAGRYTLLGKLGAGGIGVVYAAYDAELDRRVALKFLQPSGDDPSGRGRQRLVREAQALAKLSHPHVVTVYDVGTSDDQVFIAMEMIDGVSLSTWCRARPRGWHDVREMLLQASKGLIAAHDAGLIHRDFKPANVLVGADGRVRVLDFGLARRRHLDDRASDDDRVPAAASMTANRALDARVTMTGTIMGTPAYMAPEQLLGEEIGPAADQFAFCVALFEGMYGRRPFPGNDINRVREAILAGKITPPDGPSEVPPWLHRALLRGLSVEPSRRFADMRELVAAITADTLRRRRTGWILALAGVLATGSVAAGVVLTRPEITEGDRAAVDQLVDAAWAAAERGEYLYPPPGEPDARTAFRVVRELETTEGPAGALARERATQVRRELAERLVELGDLYWDREGARAFAADYYASALAFDGDLERARERASLTRGELAALLAAADNGGFTPGELAAGQTLAVLAANDAGVALDVLREGPSPPAPTTLARLEAIVGPRSTVAKPSKPTPPPAPDPEPVILDEPTPTIDPAATIPSTPAPLESPSSADTRDGETTRLLEQARAARGRGNRSGAEQLYHRVLAIQAKNPKALRGLAEIHFDRGEHHETIRYATRASKALPRDGDLRILLGDAYLKVFDYDAARQQYQAAAVLEHRAATKRIALLDQKLGR